jgi:hypothetical protein
VAVHSTDHIEQVFYYLNPITLLSMLTDPSVAKSGTHLTLLVFILSCHHKQSIMAITSLTYLTITNSSYISLVPIVVDAFEIFRENFLWKGLTYCIYFGTTLTLFFLTMKPPSNHYIPSMGMLWYLDAQVFPSFDFYFDILLFMQPVFLSFFITLFSSLFINQYNITIISISIIILYSKQLSAYDCVFVISLLLTQMQLIVKIPYMSVISFALILSTIMSPFLFMFWIQIGNMNANYLFFNGLFFWIVLATLIIEFTSAAIKEESSVKPLIVTTAIKEQIKDAIDEDPHK